MNRVNSGQPMKHITRVIISKYSNIKKIKKNMKPNFKLT
jgi:hypothetical protein